MLEQIKTLAETDNKEAKTRLYEYALETKGISLKRNKSFANMLKDFEAETFSFSTTDLNKALETSELLNSGIEPEEVPESFKVLDKTGLLTTEPELKNAPADEPGSPVEPVEPEPVRTVNEVKTSHTKHIETLSDGEYISLPYWIYDWILATKDWKTKKCPYFGSESFMEKIIFNINLKGSVLIRETRNSSFVVLQ